MPPAGMWTDPRWGGTIGPGRARTAGPLAGTGRPSAARDLPGGVDQACGTTRPEAVEVAASKRFWTSAQFTMFQIALT